MTGTARAGWAGSAKTFVDESNVLPQPGGGALVQIRKWEILFTIAKAAYSEITLMVDSREKIPESQFLNRS